MSKWNADMSNLESFLDAIDGAFNSDATPEIRWRGQYESEDFGSFDETHFSRDEIAQLCSGDENRLLDRQHIVLTWNGMSTMFEASEEGLADILTSPFMERGVYQYSR